MNTQAIWIKAPREIGDVSPKFVKDFTLDQSAEGIVKAEACVSALGMYFLSVNGKRVENDLFTPGWTSYGTRVQYQRYDVTSYVKDGNNTLGITAAKGWAHGELGFQRSVHKTCDAINVIMSLTVTYADGKTQTVITDGSWNVYTTSILFSELYDGELIDLTAEEKLLGGAIELDEAPTELVEQVGEFVREQETLFPSSLITTPAGETVIDFGQNLGGYVELKIKGKKGDRVTLSHAETLDKNGNFYTANLRTAKARMTYVLSGEEDVLKPLFVFQGFRYVRLDEYPFDKVDLSGFKVKAVYSDMKRTGYFLCGNDKINKLYSNTVWGQRSNFIDIPTDCPQRDERFGWTGDAQVFCSTAAINYDVEKFFKKWLEDVSIEQRPDGAVLGIVPRTSIIGGGISPAWGDCCTIIPWEMYRVYGNKDILRNSFNTMKRWVEYMHKAGDEEYLWLGATRYGDWLAMDTPNNTVIGATQLDLIATAFFAYSTSILVKTGHALGEDVSYYEEMYKNVRSAFRAAFMKDGLPVIYPRYDGAEDRSAITDKLLLERKASADTQTAIVLILHFGLCEENEKEKLTERLCQLIAQNGGKMSTGFVGTPYLLKALSANGRSDVAYDLLLQEENPSWLYSVNAGATTIWERWNSISTDGEIMKGMNSLNHYSYGSVFDWVFRDAVGIKLREDEVAYKSVEISPVPDRRLGFAEGRILTKQGEISVKWRYVDNKVRYEIQLPQGVKATIKLEGAESFDVVGGSYTMII